MTPQASPVVRRRRLAAELARLRRASGKTLEEAAAWLDCATSKISRIESAQVGARVHDVRTLLEFYGASEDDQDRLLTLAREARGRGWWHAYAGFASETFRTFIGLEDEATRHLIYEPHRVPGLLQTEPYARAIMGRTGDATSGDIERGLTLRMARQEVLRRDPPPALDVVLDESVLHRGRGDVMAGQCERLLTIARRPGWTLRVLPLDGEAHPYGAVPFTVLGFADPADPQVAYTELLTSGHILDQPETLGRYLAEFADLRRCALSADDSAKLIEETAGEAARRPD